MGMADRIKGRRISMGYTQEELAEKVGLQKSAIAKYENGRVENIKRSIIAQLAIVLECSPAYLMGWAEEKNTKPDIVCKLEDGSSIIVEAMMPNKEQQIKRLLTYYCKLNELGQTKALDNIEDLAKIYSNKTTDTSIPNNTSLVAEEPAPYIVAAHNEHLDEEGEIEKIRADLSKLKRPKK